MMIKLIVVVRMTILKDNNNEVDNNDDDLNNNDVEVDNND